MFHNDTKGWWTCTKEYVICMKQLIPPRPQSVVSILSITTVEPRLTATSVIQSPRYYDHVFSAQQNGHTFSLKQRKNFCWCGKNLNYRIFYNFTPLMRPQAKLKSVWHADFIDLLLAEPVLIKQLFLEAT